MKKHLIFFFCAFLTALSASTQITLIPYDGVWKFLDDGSNQGTAWRSPLYDDVSWHAGAGKLGYGQPGITTLINFGPSAKNKYVTTYFRKKISIADPSDYAFYTSFAHRDDGIIVYVNGNEVYRNNMPTGTVTYTTLASTSASHDGVKPQIFNISKSAFISGENIFAVEIHQQKVTSGDIAFDLKLTTPDVTPPSVLSINRQLPLTTSTAATSVTFRVTFSEPVNGVGKSDFLITHTGTATGIFLSGAVVAADADGQIYDVTISSVSGEGTLRLDLRSSKTGIADLVGNIILNGGYTAGQTFIIDHLPPAVLSIMRQSPATANTNLALVTYRILFNEPVKGLDINDLTLTSLGGTVSGVVFNVLPSAGSDGRSFDVTVNGITGDGQLRLDLNASGTGITDIAGTALTGGFNTGEDYLFDHTPPAIITINRQAPQNEITGAATLQFRIRFSEAVSGVDASDFTLSLGGTASGIIAPSIVINADAEGTSYDVTINNVLGTGTVRLDLNASGTEIVDALGNALTGSFTNGQFYSVSEVPLVIDIKRLNPTIENTSSLSVTYRVTFSEPVTGVDASDFIAKAVTGTVRGTLVNLATEPSGTIATEAVQPVDLEGTTYDVSIRGLAGQGKLRLDVKGSNTGIIDAGGLQMSGGFTGGETYTVVSNSGFTSYTDISPLPIASHTAEKPQAKVWSYAGKWWTVLSTDNGTKIFRLDGTTWTDVLTLGPSTNAKADCIVAGNLVHILLFRATFNSFVYSVEYDAATGNYKLWNQRPARATIAFEITAKTATMAIDASGRMWVANDGVDAIYLRYADAPYSTWSAPITLVSGIMDDDICALVSLPGKMGIMWSNQNAQRFGFRTHLNGTDPSLWTTDELPGAASAQSLRYGLADDHINLITAGDGTLYAAIKTGYDTPGQTKVGLFVRHPNGSWDDLYPVTANEGTRPVVILNESLGKIKVVYTTHEQGGDILYRESSTSAISFGEPITLIGGNPGLIYNYATSTHQTYSSEILIMATDMTTGPAPIQAVSVLAVDGNGSMLTATPTPPVTVIREGVIEKTLEKSLLIAYPNPFSSRTVLNFSLAEEGQYTLTLFNSAGTKLSVLGNGTIIPGKIQTLYFDGRNLPNGFYFVQLLTKSGSKTIKVALKR
ncbi:MAG: T9SS type A sorting domain-containing protein [Flavisolibacter sp.]